MTSRIKLAICVMSLLIPSVASAQRTFFVQGEPGPQGPAGESPIACDDEGCGLDRSLEVIGAISATGANFTGDLEVGGETLLSELEVENLVVTQSVWLPECPQGYERDVSYEDIILCQRNLDGGTLDEMVKVGEIWVDRFEASVWESADCTGARYGESSDDYPATFPDTAQSAELLYACSVGDVTPSSYLTWFQAQAACAASGKHLITNAEWQAAVVGTYDPGASAADGLCRTNAGDFCRATGMAGGTPGGEDSCISTWGAEDMIGNVNEWTADWYGQGSDDTEASQPEEYGSDGYWSVDAAATQDGGGHFPPAALRGGGWNHSDRPGAFYFDLIYSPTRSDNCCGFRCARAY